MAEAQITAVGKTSQVRSRLSMVIVLLLMLGGVGIYLWTRPVRFTGAGASGSGAAYTFPLETFVVNLNGGSRSYLRIGIALGLSHSPAHREEMPVAIVRDTILSIVSAVSPEELAQPEGKEKLKGQILQALKDRVPQLGVEDVYFTEFLVQM